MPSSVTAEMVKSCRLRAASRGSELLKFFGIGYIGFRGDQDGRLRGEGGVEGLGVLR